MGKNLPAKKYMAGERTERFLQFKLTNNGTSGDSHWIDLAHALSMVNKRHYRQGLYYYIKSISVVETTADTKIQFGTAPDTWQVKNAWKLGFRQWSKMNSLAASSIPGGDLAMAGKYHDFKVYLNNNHFTESDASDTNPTNGPRQMDDGGNVIGDSDNWDYSVIHSHDPDGNNAPSDEFSLCLLGGHTGSDNAWTLVSLCTSYVRSSNLVPDGPDQLSNLASDPLLNMFDISDRDDDVLADLMAFNDETPYDVDGVYSDTIMRAQASVGPTSAKTAMLPGFAVPCGLLEVLTTSQDGNNITILVEMAPGPYHGVYAERFI